MTLAVSTNIILMKTAENVDLDLRIAECESAQQKLEFDNRELASAARLLDPNSTELKTFNDRLTRMSGLAKQLELLIIQYRQKKEENLKIIERLEQQSKQEVNRFYGGGGS